MEEMALAVAAVPVLVVLVLIYLHFENRKYPPGPYGVPLFGYLPFLGKLFHVSLANLRKKYGNVVSVRLGGHIVVVLNDYEAIREAAFIQGDTFSGRSHTDARLHANANGIVASEGPIWKEQKRCILRAFKNLGVGKSAFECDVMYEVNRLTDYLKRMDGKQVEITELLLLPVMNIINKLLCGKRYERKDEEFKLLRTILINMRATVPILNVFSLLNSLLTSKMNFEDQFDMGKKRLFNYVTDQVESHDKHLDENDPQQDFVGMYLAEIRRNARINGVQIAPFTKANLIESVADMTFAGIEPSETCLTWSLLLVAHYPKIQQKIQRELDSLMTNDSNLSPHSMNLTPFTRATLMEVQRYVSVTPITVPHRTIRKTVFLGKKIKKDTLIFMNLYAVHHDERHFVDSYNFRPERFIDDDGQVINDDHLIPFSAGPRACLGEPMAKTMLFLLFTCLLRRFTFSFVEGQQKPSMEVASAGITVRPHPFSLIVTCRE